MCALKSPQKDPYNKSKIPKEMPNRRALLTLEKIHTNPKTQNHHVQISNLINKFSNSNKVSLS